MGKEGEETSKGTQIDSWAQTTRGDSLWESGEDGVEVSNGEEAGGTVNNNKKKEKNSYIVEF